MARVGSHALSWSTMATASLGLRFTGCLSPKASDLCLFRSLDQPDAKNQLGGRQKKYLVFRTLPFSWAIGRVGASMPWWAEWTPGRFPAGLAAYLSF